MWVYWSESNILVIEIRFSSWDSQTPRHILLQLKHDYIAIVNEKKNIILIKVNEVATLKNF